MSIPKLFDVHAHVQFAAFRDDADLVIRRALEAGVWMINVGTQKDTSVKATELAEKYTEGVYATVGLHPIHTEKSYHDPQELGAPPVSPFSPSVFSNSRELENKHKEYNKELKIIPPSIDYEAIGAGFTSRGEDFDYEFYKKLAEHPKVVAMGECGLDYYRLGEDSKEKQKSAFVKQIELASEVNKPLMIHCRQAFGDLIKILEAKSYKLKPGVVHFFSGAKEDARNLLDMGFSFSFGGVITFTREYDEVVKYIPLDRILLETDAPYVAPLPYRGKRNEPVYISEVARKIAELKSLSFEEICAKIKESALKLFALI